MIRIKAAATVLHRDGSPWHPRQGLLEPDFPETSELQVSETLVENCYPVTITPGVTRLYLDFCAGALGAFLPSGEDWQQRPEVPDHRPEFVKLIAGQNTSPAAKAALDALASGAGTVVTGQQVTLLGGPLYTPFKMATTIARARQATRAGHPHVPIFWLAAEDHDFAEISRVDFPLRKEMETITYDAAPEAARSVGGLVLGDSILPLVERATRLMGPSEAADILTAAYKPGRTLAEAFADFYTGIFAAQGLLVLDASGRDFHRLGAPVLRAGIERADEFHAALLERNHALEIAGYHAQVAVVDQSSLLFLIDDQTGARVALRRSSKTAAEPDGLWHAVSRKYSTADLIGILEAEPERISPSALLRPVFQDYLLGTSLIVGGPAEIAYFAQSALLYEKILGRQTAPSGRFSATLVEPAVGELLRRHDLQVERIFDETTDSLGKLLAERAMPSEGRRRLTEAGKALDAELAALVDWMRNQDEGLGKSAETAASKMQYQMGRLRNMAETFQLQKENSLVKQAQSIALAINPGGVMQERVHAAAYYFARYGLELAETITAEAEKNCTGHAVMWL
jgi:bacillithiol biosynthesis cysteine-adding enzyme BshC